MSAEGMPITGILAAGMPKLGTFLSNISLAVFVF